MSREYGFIVITWMELIADGSVNSADELAKELRSLHDSVFQTSTLRTLDGWVKWEGSMS